MRTFFNVSTVSLFVVLLNSCLIDIPENIDWNTDNYEPEVMVTSHYHLGFPDLAFYKNHWYVSYRESDDHGGPLTTFSKIHILRSTDFKKWDEINVYEYPGYDLREGVFSYNDKTDNLYLHIILPVIVHKQSLGTPFTLIITRSYAYRVDISPI